MATQVKTGLIANDAITDAKIANVALTGVTASSGDSSTSLATTAFVATEINSLIDSAPGALNTLNELAAAMGDDANFSTTVTNSIATKLPLAGGTMTGDIFINGGSTTERNIRIQNTDNQLYIGVEGASGNRFLGSSTGNAFFGTTSDSGLEFGTHNNVRMYIDGDGNVGIGDNAPTQPLSVSGARILVQRLNDDSSIAFANNASGTPTSHTWSAGLNYSNSNAFTIAYGASGIPSLETHKMVITTGGDVGIGTDNPGYKLDIGGTTASTANTLRLHQNNGGTALRIGAGSGNSDVVLWRIDGDGTNSNHGGATNLGGYGYSLKYFGTGSGQDNRLKLLADDGGSNAQQVVYNVGQNGDINFEQKVGIGTNTPNAKLEIKGASSTNYLQFNNSSDSELFRIDSNFKWSWGTTTPLQDFDMRNTSGNAFFALDRTNARVGIGINSSLLGTLHVAGTPPSSTHGGIIFVRNTAATASNTTFGGIHFSSSPGTDYSIGKYNVNASTYLQFRNGNNGTGLMSLASDGTLVLSPVGVTTGLQLQGRSADNNFFIQFNTHAGAANKASIGTDTGNDTLQYAANNHKFVNQLTNATAMSIASTATPRLHVGSGNQNGATGKRGVRTGRTIYNWFNYGKNEGHTYLHIKTDLQFPTGSNPQPTMSMLHIKGYSYSAESFDSILGFHNWSGVIHQPIYTNNGTRTVVSSSWPPYRSSDNYVVIVLSIGNNYPGISIDWHQAFDPYTWRDISVLAFSKNANTSGVY